MLGYIIYDEKQHQKNTFFSNELIKYCKNFSNIKLIIIEYLDFGFVNSTPYLKYKNKQIPFPNFAIIRTINPFLSYFLENNNVRLFNNYLISNFCNNKALTYSIVSKTNIPQLSTIFLNKKYLNKKHLNTLNYPYVLKSIDGHGGKETFLIKNNRELTKKLSEIKSNEFILQDVCVPWGKDLRVYVLGTKVVASILRTASTGFKSNYSLGGKIEKYKLNNKQKKAINTILSILPAKPDFIGIDFLLKDNQLYFNEIEDVVGTRMLYTITNINIIKKYCNYIKKEIIKC